MCSVERIHVLFSNGVVTFMKSSVLKVSNGYIAVLVRPYVVEEQAYRVAVEPPIHCLH